jgi:hypothetical protein
MKREKRIENGFREGALLKTGELLVVLHSLKRRYSDALVDLQKASKLNRPVLSVSSEAGVRD